MRRSSVQSGSSAPVVFFRTSLLDFLLQVNVNRISEEVVYFMVSPEIVENLLANLLGPEFPGLVLALDDGETNFVRASGNFRPDSQYFIASATKLYITALCMQAVDLGYLKLNDRAVDILPSDLIHRLHVIDGIDYTDQITIEHLLSHRSGLPDYFQAIRKKSKKSLLDQILANEDQSWNFEQVLRDSRELGGVFAPSSKRALYSDTNYQLLGAIVETLFKSSLANIIQSNICQKIGMKNSYLYEDTSDPRPALLNHKRTALNIPKAMTSFGADGGVVSTAEDGIAFLKGFFEGHLFRRDHLTYLSAHWFNIFFPLKYGVGISLFRLPWYFSPFTRVPDLLGHSGLSGAFLFYCPSRNLYFSGTVNQTSKPQTSFRLMVKILLNSSN